MDTNTPSMPKGRVSAIWPTLSFVCAVLVLCFGIFAAIQMTTRADQQNRATLLSLVKTIAYLSPADDIASLAGTSADLSTDTYKRVKQSLFDLRAIDKNTRFVYYMRAVGDGSKKLLFLADSEDPSSHDYSPPGQVYQDTTTTEYKNYVDEVAFTEGPYPDRWGTWVSAYAPVRTGDGKQVAIVGIDVNGKLWTSQLLSISLSIGITSVILAILFFILGLYLKRSIHIVTFTQRMNDFLTREKKHSDEIVDKAHIGQWMFSPKTGHFSCNAAMCSLFGVAANETVSIETIKSKLSLEGVRAFDHMMEEFLEKGRAEAMCDITLTTNKKIHMSATAEGGSSMMPTRISGIAQNIT